MWQMKQRYEIHNTTLATALPLHIHMRQVGNSKKNEWALGLQK